MVNKFVKYITIIFLFISPIVYAGTDEIFKNGFEDIGCGFGTELPRQMIGDVSFLSNPGRHYLQSLTTFGSLFGFFWDCPMVHGECIDVVPFPGMSGPAPILRMNANSFVALQFTTEHIGEATNGAITISTSNHVFSKLEFSMSDRCGDFDRTTGFLSTHPNCIQQRTPKAGSFKWAVVPSDFVCSITDSNGNDDHNKIWYFNMRVIECEYTPICPVNFNNN